MSHQHFSFTEVTVVGVVRYADIVTIPEKVPICTPGTSGVLFCTLCTEEYTAVYQSVFYSGTQEYVTKFSHNIWKAPVSIILYLRTPY